MFKKIAVSFATLALAVAGAASNTYKITLFEPTTVNGQQLRAGDYKVEVQDSKAVITTGKQSVEAPVKVESGAEKFRGTTVRYSNSNGQLKIQEIWLGGTTTKLVFGNESASLR